MKKALLLTAGLAVALSMTACGAETKPLHSLNDKTQKAVETTITKEANTLAKVRKIELPSYVYPEANSPTAAVADYMVTEFAKDYEKADVSIPAITVIDDNDDNPNDIKVWGIFELYNYNQKGDTLECQSGGVYSGLMHVKMDKNGKCTVTSVELTEDGSNFDPSAKKIFGKHYNEFMEELSDEKEREETKKEFVEDYVEANQLSITQYKDYGWDPVKLELME